MTSNKLARGLLEIPKGMNTSHSDNYNFMNNLERTNTLLGQFLSSPEEKRMMMRTELEESYFNLIIYNLKESIKHKIEQDMWNNLFKRHVAELQGKMKSKDKIEASKAQSELSLFLDEAIGFYSKFLDVLSLIHNIRLPGRRLSNVKCLGKDSRSGDEVCEQDIYYIVQHCFIHLGDLSRYHNLHKLARLNYQFAVALNPLSGHAYNQLAILESSSVSQVLNHTNYSRLLHTLLYYDFASTCIIPFPATRINLDSLLRHIHLESVSELLTSNNSIDANNCLSSLSVAWLHAYASMRLRNNIQRCRQLQQRIVDWTGGLVKHHEISSSNWRDLVTILALQCALLSSYDAIQETAEVTSWSSNLQQFTQDLINALCYGLVSISHDMKHFEDLLNNPSCVGVIIVFMTWSHLFTANDERKITLQIPFGEQFVKFVNILCGKVNISDLSIGVTPIQLPISLPELQYLKGYEPLKIPCEKLKIFSDYSNSENVNTVDRASFIVSVTLKIAQKYISLITYDKTACQFSSVILPLPPLPVSNDASRRPLSKTIDPLIVTKKSVNVALASIIGSNTNSTIDCKKNIVPSNKAVASPPSLINQLQLVTADVKIAKCIQEHIALETTNCLPLTPLHHNDSSLYDDTRSLAPAPGLILSSNLPPEYKTMSSLSSHDSPEQAKEHSSTNSITTTTQLNDLIDSATATSSSKSNCSPKSHTYNPNREQFEKDLPPRFANKRTTNTQKEIAMNKTGFKSLNYWDSNNDASEMMTNLTKKESELPSVPSSWMFNAMDDDQDLGNVDLSSRNFHISNEIINNQQHQQRSNSFNNSPLLQGSLNMFQPSYNQFQKQALMTDQDNKMKNFLAQQTTCSNHNGLTFQQASASNHLMDPARAKFDQMLMSQSPAIGHGMQQNFPPIPPPPQNMHTQNFDQLTINRPNYYDKPIFSTSNQSGFGYTSSSIMAQQQQQSQQQYNHQVRSNNPLLNLLPGFMNEIQR